MCHPWMLNDGAHGDATTTAAAYGGTCPSMWRCGDTSLCSGGVEPGLYCGDEVPVAASCGDEESLPWICDGGALGWVVGQGMELQKAA